MAVMVKLVGADDMPLLYANHFVLQREQDEYILTIGQIAPPVLIGTPQQQREQARQIEYVPARVLVRLALNETRLREMLDVLQQRLETDQT